MTPLRRRLRSSALLAAFSLGLSATAARADEVTPLPYESLGTLRRLQEQVAHGSTAAQSAQGALMDTLATRFVAADPAVWRDPRNARAAVLYLFSGGKPNVIRTILARSTMPGDIDRLLKGALAYAEGQDQIARDLLSPIDPCSLPAALGGQLALVEATLAEPSDPKGAAHFFDLARLLVPGSLVEEAALRRQAVLEASPDRLGRFIFLSRQYLHRFQASIYARNFKQHFAAVALQLASDGDVAALNRMQPAVNELPLPERRALLLAMAKTAVVRGHTDAARLVATQAAQGGAGSAGDAARAKLYLEAASILSGDVRKGVAALERADRTRLSAADADLADAALAMAHAVEAPVAGTAPAGAAGGDDAGSAALLDQARDALRSGDALLDKAP